MATEILIEAFNGRVISEKKDPRKEYEKLVAKKKSTIPENINLQNYVDSSDESDSEVEYESDSDDEVKKEFIESNEFTGSKSGYIYKNGDKGLGYYKVESVNKSVST